MGAYEYTQCDLYLNNGKYDKAKVVIDDLVETLKYS